MRNSWEQKTTHGRWGLVSPDHRAAFRWEVLEADGGRHTGLRASSLLSALLSRLVWKRRHSPRSTAQEGFTVSNELHL